MGRPRMYNQEEVNFGLCSTYKTVLPLRNIVESNEGLLDIYLFVNVLLHFLSCHPIVIFPFTD